MNLSDSDFQNRLEFAEIDSNTVSALQTIWPVIHPALDDLLRDFYNHVKKVPELSKLIGDHQTRLVSAQKTHWEKLFTSGFDADYQHSINAIGHVHCRIGLEPKWYIAGYKFVLVRLNKFLVRKYRRSMKDLGKILEHVTAAVMLDMDLAISTYEEQLLLERAEQAKRLNQGIDVFRERVEEPLSLIHI